MFNWNLFALFVVLNIVNVVLQTIKSICTIKCGKTAAALINALAYGLYTIVVIYMVCELPLMVKVAVVALANFVGVYAVKHFEEAARKDKLWKVEMTIPTNPVSLAEIYRVCVEKDIPMNSFDVEGYHVLNFFCSTKEQSRQVKRFVEIYGGKCFVSESKVL